MKNYLPDPPGINQTDPGPWGGKEAGVKLPTRRVYRSLLADGRIPGFACMGTAKAGSVYTATNKQTNMSKPNS